MNLIDRYVAEVADHLPKKMREDLSKEIRSLIEDTLEDQAKQTGKAVTDEGLITDVLKSFGSPEKMAASYLPTRYLIGPRLLPSFWLVTRIGILLAVLVSVITLGMEISETGRTVHEIVGLSTNFFSDFFTVALSIFGNIVLIFAIIELLLPKFTKEKEQNWDPRTLKDPVDYNHANLSKSIVSVFFTLLALIVFNLYPQWIGVGFTTNGTFTYAPILTAVFFTYLPWLNVLWVLELVKDSILVRENRWSPLTHWMDIVLHAAGIFIVLMMAFGAPIAALPAGSTFASKTTLASLFDPLLRGILILAAAAAGVDMIRSLYHMIKK